MTRTVFGKTSFVAIAAICAAAAMAGCSSSPSGQPGTGSEENGSKGTVGMAIEVAPGIVVNSVDYHVTGNGVDITGSIAVTDPNSTVSVQIGLPAGAGYQVSMTAVSTLGVHCAGSAPFNVTAGLTSQIFVDLACDATNNGDNIGGTIVNGRFIPGNPNTCPDVAFYTVAPLQTSTGQPIALNGAGTAGATTTAWTVTAGSGTIADPAAAATTFTCTAPGTHTLTFTVTDGHSCTDSQSINVTCINPGVCGNGTLEAGEQCDDGNTADNDGCSHLCQHEPVCGDGTVEGPEQCDPPNPGFCSSTCQNVAPLCGDGFIQAGETCEPPNTATCDANCHSIVPAVCGDGVINQPDEQCEPPNTATCDANCHNIVANPCGNGTIDPGEECDPPSAKFCDSTCHLGGTCTTCEEANCGGPDIHTACTGGAGADLCIAALDCSRDNSCYQLDPSICYCGAVDIVACQGATGPAGPCIAQYNAAAGSTAAGTVLLALTDPSTALGRAGFIQQCDAAFCQAECF